MIRRYLTASIFLLATLLAGCAGPGFEPVIEPLKPIDRLRVSVSYKENGIYQLKIINNLSSPVSLLWNESAYLNTAGIGTRLIHIATPADLDKTPPHEQKSSTIAPHGRLQTDFVGESWIDYARRGVSPKPRDDTKKARIDLTFSINGKRARWRAAVGFEPTD